MVQNISSSNNTQSNFKEFKKNSYTNMAPSQPIAPSKDEVIIKKEKSSNKSPVNKLQVAVLILGGLASAAFLGVLLKGLVPNKNKYKDLTKRIMGLDLPENIRKALQIELDKLKKSFVDSDNTEVYIEQLLRMPWKRTPEKIVNITNARKILDEEHVGLDKVKDEIIKIIRKKNYNLKNNIKNDMPLIICLDGPPGIGKTSIAESIAKAMDKKFQRISLAGISHKSFVKGSERLYKGSEPGQIAKAFQNAEVSNPVILIDEIDKMGRSTEHGDPAFALLDILEPKQCKNFVDDYLGVPYDLSDATFIITSNNLNKIPDVLRDRLSVIHLPAYTKQDKINIGKHTLEKMMKESMLDKNLIDIKPEAIDEIVKRTNDSGARKTVKNIESVINEIKQEIEKNGADKKLIIDKNFVNKSVVNFKQDEVNEALEISDERLLKIFERLFNQKM